MENMNTRYALRDITNIMTTTYEVVEVIQNTETTEKQRDREEAEEKYKLKREEILKFLITENTEASKKKKVNKSLKRL